MKRDLKLEISRRIDQLRDRLEKQQLKGMIVLNPVNIRYLTGFTGEFAVLLVLKEGSWMIAHERCVSKAERETSGCTVHPLISERLTLPDDLIDQALTMASEHSVKNLAVDSSITQPAFLKLRRQARPIRLQLSEAVEAGRMIKSAYEIHCLKRAQAEAEIVFTRFLHEVKAGRSEKQLYDRLLQLIYENEDLEGPSFLPIVASGESAWTIHSHYTRKKLKTNDCIIIDMGVRYQGYCSDMTRTVFVGKPTADMKTVYQVVAEAQQAAEIGIRPGMYNHSADALARKSIERHGLGKFFSHGLGHSVGLEVHEAPYLHYRKKRQIIRERMIFTLEPGIYQENRFGIRIEDMVMLTPDGCQNLTTFTKELITL